MGLGDMGRFWDERAREDPFYFVDNSLRYRETDMDVFWARGEQQLHDLMADLELEIEPGAVAVDIGCGLGRLTRVIAARAAAVYAIDVSAEMLARARELNAHLTNVTWLEGDGHSLGGIGDESATLCLSHVVFQHIPDPAVTLGYIREMGRVLRSGGRAGFQISNDPSIHRLRFDREQWRVRLGSLLGRAPRRQSHPAWRGAAMDLDEVRQAASEGGLAVERIAGEGTQFCYVRLRKD